MWDPRNLLPSMEDVKTTLSRPAKPKQWKPDALETVMYAAVQAGTHPNLVMAALKAIALAAGYGMPRPEIAFRDDVVEFVWKARNKHGLYLWLRNDGKLDFATTNKDAIVNHGDESGITRDVAMEMITHFFVAWGAR